MDDSLSLAASDAEELSDSVTDLVLLPPSSSHNARLRTDEELMRIMTKAVNELWLKWSLSEDSSRCRLDEWSLPGHHQAPCQRSSPFFSEVHDELTKSWHAPYSSRIRPSASAALTSIDSAEEKGYECLSPLDESGSIGWKARASQPSKPCRVTCTFPAAYSVAGQAALALHSMAVLQVFQAKMLASEEAGLDAASLRDLRSPIDLALRATKPPPRPSAINVQPGSVGTPPLAHDDGDEIGGQGSLPRRSSLVKQPVWTSCGGLCGMLPGGSEVVSSDTTLPPETHQLFCCFQLP